MECDETDFPCTLSRGKSHDQYRPIQEQLCFVRVNEGNTSDKSGL